MLDLRLVPMLRVVSIKGGRIGDGQSMIAQTRAAASSLSVPNHKGLREGENAVNM
jgi:phage replication-related protein YjqB (UPF0714/DUF867 family)